MVAVTRRQFLASVIAGATLTVGAGTATTTYISAASQRDKWRNLEQQLRGRVIFPSDRAYWKLSTPANARYLPIRPQAVAAIESEADAAVCIRWCQENNMPFSVRGGGHSFGGFSTTEGLLISTSKLTSHHLDQSGGILRAGAGLTNSDLGTVLADGGRGRWMLPVGSCLSVGIGGLVLGGGVGPNAPWAGLTSDRLHETTLVMASGETVAASSSENEDLYWAVRGAGGGNFGIHTDFTFELVPIPEIPVTSGILTTVGRENSVAAAIAWQKVLRDNARVASGSFRIESALDSAVIGSARIQILAGRADALDILKPLIEVAKTWELTERSWWDGSAWYSYASPAPASNWYRSTFLYDDLSDEALDAQARLLEKFDTLGGRRNAHLAIQGYVGGEVNRLGRMDTAYVHRGAFAIARLLVSWPPAWTWALRASPIPDNLVSWGETAWSALGRHVSSEAYQNFPDPMLTNWSKAYYGENLDRLVSVKRKFDGDNIFKFPQSVPLS